MNSNNRNFHKFSNNNRNTPNTNYQNPQNQPYQQNQPPMNNNNINTNDDFFKFKQFEFPDMEQFNDDEDIFFHHSSNPQDRQGNPIDYMMNRMQLPFQEIQNEMNKVIGNNFSNLDNFGGFIDEGNSSNQNQMMPSPNAPNNQMVRGNVGPNFQNVHMTQRPGQGTVLAKTYVSSTKYGQDGKPEKEVYQSQSINQYGDDGHKISERQEAYKNSLSGIEKAAHQRMLDDRGHKLVKERNRNTGDQNEHNLYKGMQEDQLNNFNNDFNSYKQKVGFDKNYPLLQKMNVKDGLRQIGYNNNNYNNYNNRLPQGNNAYGQGRQGYNQPAGYLGNGDNNNYNNNYNNYNYNK